MNVLLLFVALHFGFLASFCQGDGSFSALDSPSSTEWDEYVTSEISCSEDDEWWSDSSCSFCRCKCETRESSSGVSETTCVSRCYDYSDSSSYSAIYEAADYCGYSCDYYRELRIDYSESSCDCDSITYSCSNYNDSSTVTEMPSSTDTDRTSNEVKTTVNDDDASSTDMPSTSEEDRFGTTSNDDIETTTTIATRATDDNTEDYSTTDGRIETQNTDLSMSSTEESDDDDDYSTTSDGSSDTESTDVLMSSTEEGSDDDDVDSIYNDGESETVADSDADYSYLYIKLGLQVTRIWDSRSEVWDILRKALRDVMSNSPDYDADTTNIYFLYWDAYKVDDDTSIPTTTMSTNDDEPTTTTISVTSVDSGGRRRRRHARALLEDSTRNSEEVTVQFYFSLAVYFGNSDDAQDWYDYLTSLGDGSSSSSSSGSSASSVSTTTESPSSTDTDDDNDESFGTRYVSDCDDEARTYDTNGWGDITLTDAYIGLYDSDGTVIEETSYNSNDNSNSNSNTNGNSDTTVPSSSSGNSGNSIYGNVNSVIIVSIFAAIVHLCVW